MLGVWLLEVSRKRLLFMFVTLMQHSPANSQLIISSLEPINISMELFTVTTCRTADISLASRISYWYNTSSAWHFHSTFVFVFRRNISGSLIGRGPTTTFRDSKTNLVYCSFRSEFSVASKPLYCDTTVDDLNLCADISKPSAPSTFLSGSWVQQTGGNPISVSIFWINHCPFLADKIERMPSMGYTATPVVLIVVAVLSDNKWIESIIQYMVQLISQSARRHCWEIPSLFSYFFVSFANVIRNHTRESGSSRSVFTTWKRRSIIFSAKFNLTQINVSHILHVQCAVAVSLLDTVSHQDSTKFIVLHECYCDFVGIIFAVCNAFNVSR